MAPLHPLTCLLAGVQGEATGEEAEGEGAGSHSVEGAPAGPLKIAIMGLPNVVSCYLEALWSYMGVGGKVPPPPPLASACPPIWLQLPAHFYV